MQVVFCMASHERESITKQNVDYLSQFGTVVLVVSYGRELDYFTANTSAKVFSYPNSPLGSKWQYSIEKARRLNPDLLVTVGSDDFISKNYIENAKKFIAKGYEFVGINGWLMSDGKRHYKAKYKHLNDFPAGSGRVFTKSCLDKINWVLFDTKRNKLLDDLALAKMKRANVKTYISQDPEKDGLKILAMKGKWKVLNPLDNFMKAPSIQCERIFNLGSDFPTIQL